MLFKLELFLIFSTSLLVNYFLVTYYTGGDQILYNAFYDSTIDLPIELLLLNSNNTIGTIEPIYPIIIWAVSSTFAKNNFIIFVNCVFSTLSFVYLKKAKVNLLHIILIIFTNYYFIVLYTSAERLKFGFLLMSLMLLFKFNKRIIFFIGLCSIVTHTQLIFFFSNALVRITKIFNIKFLIIIIAPLLIYLDFIIPQVLSKLDSYADRSEDYFGAIKLIVFMILTYLAKPVIQENLIYFIPLIFGTFLFGSERLVIVSYFIFLYTATQNTQKNNKLILAVNLYLSYKSIDFVSSIINFGDGYHNILGSR